MIGLRLHSFALTLGLLVTVGCKNSAKDAPTPGGSSTPATSAVRVQLPVAAPTAAPTPVQAFPGPPIPVAPPASFNADQLPTGRVEFAVSGKAGQVLFIRTKEVVNAHYNYGGDRRYTLSVQLAANGSSPLEAIQEGGTCTDNALYALPRTGTYRVVFAPLPGEKHGVDFETISSDDPLVDPGIKPESISIDFGSLAPKGQIEGVPLSMPQGCLDDAWPSHLAVHGRGFSVRIMPVAGYKKAFAPDSSMDLLQSALQKRVKDTSVIELPYSTNGDAGLDLSTQPQFLEGDGWHGLRWIGEYSQDPSCRFEKSTYVFQGISDDGRFFILMQAGVSNPALVRRLTQDCDGALQKTASRDVDVLFKKDMRDIFDRDMTAADPASFTPNLDQLDAVIRSLKLKQ